MFATAAAWHPHHVSQCLPTKSKIGACPQSYTCHGLASMPCMSLAPMPAKAGCMPEPGGSCLCRLSFLT
eukprot:3377578-Prorocentrum_lima.AAC.1